MSSLYLINALVLQNKNFLKINSNCTAKEFSAIMADHYESLEHEYQSDIRGDNAMEIETAENFDSRRKPNSRIFRTVIAPGLKTVL